MKGKKQMAKLLDKSWSKVILSKGRCEVCGKTDTLNAHHYISRSNRRLRWDLRNGICTCVGCHLFKNNSFHKNPVFGHNWMLENRLEDLQYLEETMNDIQKWTVQDMELRLQELK